MCKAQSSKTKTTGNLLQQHIATEKGVQSQERVLNASNISGVSSFVGHLKHSILP